jgi:hypothetical protein
MQDTTHSNVARPTNHGLEDLIDFQNARHKQKAILPPVLAHPTNHRVKDLIDVQTTRYHKKQTLKRTQQAAGEKEQG